MTPDPQTELLRRSRRLGTRIGQFLAIVLIAWTFGAWQESLAAGLWMFFVAGLADHFWGGDG